eukprot:gnl/Trimastix_PCT/27.p1 GENE.gnl/Trimastix_PCT/27~~gnl/Trimastix_PCT/27.p1  ORF type:complete len:556 (+),score=177.88 gnl/Trimastix_PCT/27:1381-3048(+)
MADIESTPMFCYQCEQTADGTACVQYGRCAKSPEVAALQDHLISGVKSLGLYWDCFARAGGDETEIPCENLPMLICSDMFSTLTNVNFDAARFHLLIAKAEEVRNALRDLCAARNVEVPDNWYTRWTSSTPHAESRIDLRMKQLGATRAGLQELLLYGMKGIAAYATHVVQLGEAIPADVVAFIRKALAFLTEADPSVDALLGICLECGAANLAIMEALDRAHTGTFGNPVPTEVHWGPKPGKCILISGHDLHDLKVLLEATKDLGINIYTHGEMLPAHGYPALKAYPHFAGHYGTAWQNQTREFAAFPGAIVLTTNCLMTPAASYRNRIFTMNEVGFTGIPHIEGHDYTALIAAAQAAEGFPEGEHEAKKLTVGFGHHTVKGVAPQILEAVAAGQIKHFFLIGGCDGAEPGRNYYTEFASQVPQDCLILTLACGKFRINHLDLGSIGSFPRLLDVGQCNDAYSAIQIAVALAGALNCGVNDLPLSMIISWFEQKAVAILLTLLHLGIKDIILGPALPAFVTPEALGVLVEKFGIGPITTPEADLAKCLNKNKND